MFKVNDTVMYSNFGVCKIVNIGSQNFSGQDSLYYTLYPVYEDKTTIYCPVDSDKIKIRKLLSAQDVYKLIKCMPDETEPWTENDHLRKDEQNTIIGQGDHRELIKLIRTLYFKRDEKNKQGKKFHAADEKAMCDAEKLLYQEFAKVLNIQPDEVVPFITDTLEGVGANKYA